MRLRIPFLAVWLLGLVFLPRLAPDAERIAIRAARILDPVTGGYRAERVIVVEGGTIHALLPEPPADVSQVLDLGDRTVLPGLIDAHVHLAYELDREWFLRPVRELAADAAIRAVRKARKTLLAGFTTVRDLGSLDFVAVALMRAVDRGIVPGP